MTGEGCLVKEFRDWNRSRDAYHIASNGDGLSVDPWLSGLFVVPCIPACDSSGVRGVNSAPAGRNTHPKRSCEIEL